MIVPLEMAKKLPGYLDMAEEEVTAHLGAVESRIRAITHNDFRNLDMDAFGYVQGGNFRGPSQYFQIGDRVQVSQCVANNGLYDIVMIAGDLITLDRPLYECDHLRLAKVVYPPDVQAGAIAILKWEQSPHADKAGIASESLSRHSVSYVSGEYSGGYPKALTSFLAPYMKARF